MVMLEGLFFFAKFSILKTYCLLQGTILHPKTIVRYAVELTPYAIFDMDGTLLCSTGMWDHVTDRILAKYGRTITHEQRMANMTLTVEGTAAMFVQQLGVPLTEPECAELIRAEARYGYAQEATVKPGVEQVLAAMHARGVRMCVASGTETPLIEAALTSHGLMRWFEFAVDCKNPDGKKKPDVYLDALHRFGVQNPVQATVFEDSPVGIATARAAGFATVGIYDEPMAEFWPQITQTADFASRTWQDWLQNVQQTGPAPHK